MIQLQKYVLLILCIQVLASCNTSIEVTKRRYSSGYHVDVHSNKKMKVCYPEIKQDITVATKLKDNNLDNSADINSYPAIIQTPVSEKVKIPEQQVSYIKRVNKLLNKVKTFARSKSSVTSDQQLQKDPAATPILEGGYSFFKIFLLALLLAFLILILLIIVFIFLFYSVFGE